MSRKIVFLLLVAIIVGAQSIFASEDPPLPENVINNRFFLESQRLAELAQTTYEYGDYDTSAMFAHEATRNAQLSDEFVARQLKIKETNDAIAAAKTSMDRAVSSGAADKHPFEYSESQSLYNASLTSRANEEWDDAILAANMVVELLAHIDGPRTPSPGAPLPAQYTVRTWLSVRDCLWNIAGRFWAYDDPFKWRILYEANKSKLPDPNNPNLIEPGTIIDIPSIRGETRQGMWEPGR